VNANADLIGRIATGEAEDGPEKMAVRAKAGRKGAKRRAASLTPEQRSEIAREAAAARWKKS
jgi:hypothetical protein